MALDKVPELILLQHLLSDFNKGVNYLNKQIIIFHLIDNQQYNTEKKMF